MCKVRVEMIKIIGESNAQILSVSYKTMLGLVQYVCHSRAKTRKSISQDVERIASIISG